MPRTSEAGIALIKTSEGLRLRPYRDPSPHGGFWTVGWGHFLREGEALEEITLEEAERLFELDLYEAEDAVYALVKVWLNQNQWDAMVDFTFNEGYGNLAKSTLLRRLNREDYAGIPHELRKWTYSSGKHLAGLVTRRENEIKLWNKKDPCD
jgi:lysozyme